MAVPGRLRLLGEIQRHCGGQSSAPNSTHSFLASSLGPKLAGPQFLLRERGGRVWQSLVASGGRQGAVDGALCRPAPVPRLEHPAEPPLATRRQSLSKSPRVKTGRLPSRCSVGSAAMGSVRPPGPSLSPRRALLAGAAAWVAQGAAASCSSGRERGKGRRAGTASFPAQEEPLLPREGGETPDMSSEAPAGMERPGPGERVFPSEALAFPPSSPVLCREGCWEVNRSWKKSSLRVGSSLFRPHAK